LSDSTCRKKNKKHYQCLQTPRTLEEVGHIFDITRERVRQIEEKAKEKLRHHSRANILKKYMDTFEEFNR